MRLLMKAFVALMTCLSVHAYGLQDIQLPHIELPQVHEELRSAALPACFTYLGVNGLVVVGTTCQLPAPRMCRGALTCSLAPHRQAGQALATGRSMASPSRELRCTDSAVLLAP